jgi:hypothetical protein
MTGGLIQLVSYGIKDIFLTSNPQITFFKFVYQRYTNFAVETILLKFNNIYDFDKLLTCEIPNNGDLIHKCCIRLVLPSVSLPKSNTVDTTTAKLSLNIINGLISNFNKYINYIYNSIRRINDDIDKNNVTINTLKTTVTNYLSSGQVAYEFSKIKKTQTVTITDKYDIQQIIDNVIATSLNDSNKKILLKKIIKDLNNQAKIHNKKLLDDKITIQTNINTAIRDQYNFAWVENIGFNIIEYVEIYISGVRIDQQYGEWLYIWNEINKTMYKEDLINKMNGNISKLTTYDSNTKDEYIIYVPLKFWFNVHSGCALPLISAKQNTVELTLKLSKLADCIYTDCTDNDILTNNINLATVDLLVDYIFLSQPERDIFASNKLEYLINQSVYTKYFMNSNDSEHSISIDHVHPSKYIIWTLQISSYINKYNLHNKYNLFRTSSVSNSSSSVYPTIDNESTIDLPVSKSIINLNNNNLTPLLNITYNNNIIPYEIFNKTPSDGIYCYSFSLQPLNDQPYGSCNFSRIKSITLNNKINPVFLKLTGNNDIVLKLHIQSYNVLEFSNGSAKLLF